MSVRKAFVYSPYKLSIINTAVECMEFLVFLERISNHAYIYGEGAKDLHIVRTGCVSTGVVRVVCRSVVCCSTPH